MPIDVQSTSTHCFRPRKLINLRVASTHRAALHYELLLVTLYVVFSHLLPMQSAAGAAAVARADQRLQVESERARDAPVERARGVDSAAAAQDGSQGVSAAPPAAHVSLLHLDCHCHCDRRPVPVPFASTRRSSCGLLRPALVRLGGRECTRRRRRGEHESARACAGRVDVERGLLEPRRVACTIRNRPALAPEFDSSGAAPARLAGLRCRRRSTCVVVSRVGFGEPIGFERRRPEFPPAGHLHGFAASERTAASSGAASTEKPLRSSNCTSGSCSARRTGNLHNGTITLLYN